MTSKMGCKLNFTFFFLSWTLLLKSDLFNAQGKIPSWTSTNLSFISFFSSVNSVKYRSKVSSTLWTQNSCGHQHTNGTKARPLRVLRMFQTVSSQKFIYIKLDFWEYIYVPVIQIEWTNTKPFWSYMEKMCFPSGFIIRF